MELVTLHDLSLMFDLTVRALRSRVRHLVRAGKLLEGRDWRRDDYVDATHFTWMISPEAFTRETGLMPVTARVTEVAPAVTQTDTPRVTATAPTVNQGEQTLPKVDTSSPAMEREMIDLLKSQLGVKDGQIADLTAQNKAVVALNEKLTGTIVQFSDHILGYLRLVGARAQPDDLVTKTGSTVSTVDTHSVTPPATAGDQPAKETEAKAA